MHPWRTAVIKGLPVSQVTVDQALGEMARAIEARARGRYVSITNTESMYYGLRDAELGRFIRGADLSLCDGVGVVAAGLPWGYRLRRLTGPQLQLECSRYGVARGWRHFYYGGKPGVADTMAERLKAQFPGLIVCGTYSPPFRAPTPAEDAEVIARINATRPDIVWVGLGLPKQERWIASHLGRIDAAWMVGVGAAFDYHSGAVPWAPPWARRVGLEWTFRLAREPRLRTKRYGRALLYVLEAWGAGVATAQFLRR